MTGLLAPKWGKPVKSTNRLYLNSQYYFYISSNIVKYFDVDYLTKTAFRLKQNFMYSWTKQLDSRILPSQIHTQILDSSANQNE